MTLTLDRRNHLSILLVFSMLFSIFILAATPPAEAGFFRTLGKIGRGIVVAAAAITGGVFGATVGCLGGGPVGAIAGLTMGATLAGIAMSGLTSNVGTSALTGASIGALIGGPAGMLGGAVVGGLVGGAIGYAADDDNFAGGHGKKGDHESSGHINLPDQTPDQTPGQRETPGQEASAESALPEAEEITTPETPAYEEADNTYSETTEDPADNTDNNNDLYFQDPENMSVDESVNYLISQSVELDRQRNAVLADEASPADYESMLDQRNLVAENLSQKLIAEIEANKGNPGSEYNQFTSRLSKLNDQNKAAVQDIIKTVKDSAVHCQLNSLEGNNYEDIANDLSAM